MSSLNFIQLPLSYNSQLIRKWQLINTAIDLLDRMLIPTRQRSNDSARLSS